MQKFLTLLLCLLSGLPLSAGPGFGTSTQINDGWTFIREGIARKVDLPHDWSVEGPASASLASCTGYLPGGKGEYRKDLFIPSAERGRRLYLYFGGIYCNSEVFVNGTQVAARPNGYVSFLCDITSCAVPGRTNEVRVTVDHSRYADSRWYTGSGIYRDVYLVSAAPVHLDRWGTAVSTRPAGEGAVLTIDSRIANDSGRKADAVIRHRIFEKDGSRCLASGQIAVQIPAGETAQARCIMEMADAKRWNLDAPSLYRVETEVVEGRKVIDGNIVITGVREFRFDPDQGFSLNGNNMKIKGVCMHHDAGSLGSAVPVSVLRSRLIRLKSIGCNAIRTSHNPQSEEFYDLCDELGLLVMDEAFDEWEFPKKKWIEGWNVGDAPGKDGYAAHFQKWGTRDLADMVLRDRNHPCIFMWSIGNEVDYPNDPYSHPILDSVGINQKTIPGFRADLPRAERIGGIAATLASVVRSIDSTRVVTGAMAGVVMSNCTAYPDVLDVTGYNYTENRYLEDHERYPHRIIYGSENRHEFPHWKAVADHPHIFGQFLWTGFDYLGESGRFPSRGMATGLFDLGGFIKPRGEYRKCLWSDTPTVYAGTIRRSAVKKGTLFFDQPPVWNYKEGEDICVAVMSNCDSAALFLNGRRIDTEPFYSIQSDALVWAVPFSRGELKAVGYLGGAAATEYAIRTHGPAHHLSVSADRDRFDGTGDVVQVVLEILDVDGNRALGCTHKAECRVTGGARLLKLENAHPHYTGSFEGNALPVYKGRILAYIIATEPKGSVHVDFSVPALDETIRLTLNK